MELSPVRNCTRRPDRLSSDGLLQRTKRKTVLAPYYTSDTLPALLFLEFVQMCFQNLPVAVYKSCHRLFVPFSSRVKYCERVLDLEIGATCKDIAAKLAYAEELKADKAKALYNKARNRYQTCCSRAPRQPESARYIQRLEQTGANGVEQVSVGGVYENYVNGDINYLCQIFSQKIQKSA